VFEGVLSGDFCDLIFLWLFIVVDFLGGVGFWKNLDEFNSVCGFFAGNFGETSRILNFC
jgi:hypothetical protein